MSTMHERWARHEYETEMLDPHIALEFHRFLALVRSGQFSAILPAMGVTKETHDYAQLMITWRILLEVSAGHISAAAVYIGSPPNRDHLRSENQALLASRLPDPYEAQVDVQQHMADYDGVLRWHAAIPVLNCRTGKHIEAHVSQVPLEIGSTKPSRLWWHLTAPEYQGVARWPYGDDLVHIYVRKLSPL